MPAVRARSLEVLYLHPFPYGQRQAEGRAPAGLPTYPAMPMGALGLCNLLGARGHRVRGLNLPVERMLDPSFVLEGWLLACPEAELVLIDLHWHEHALGALELAASVRAAWPKARVVLGGMSATLFAREILDGFPAVDAVVLGDAERTLPLLAAGGPWPPPGLPNLAVRGGETTPERWVADGATISDQDFVDLGFLEHADAYRRLLYSHPRRGGAAFRAGAKGHWLCNGRGCVHACAPCGGGRTAQASIFGRQGIGLRSPTSLARDLWRLAERGVEQAALGLDPELAGAAHLDAWLSGAPDNGLYLESFGLPSSNLLDGLTRHAHLDRSEIAITAVSGDEDLRRRHGKGFDTASLLRTVEALQERRISASVYFSMGLPGEDERAFAATLSLARRLAERDGHGLLRIGALPIALDPGSPMALEPATHGLELTDAGDLASRLARARSLADGSLSPIAAEAQGYRIVGCDVVERAARWNELAVTEPERFVPIPGA